MRRRPEPAGKREPLTGFREPTRCVRREPPRGGVTLPPGVLQEQPAPFTALAARTERRGGGHLASPPTSLESSSFTPALRCLAAACLCDALVALQAGRGADGLSCEAIPGPDARSHPKPGQHSY